MVPLIQYLLTTMMSFAEIPKPKPKPKPKDRLTCVRVPCLLPEVSVWLPYVMLSLCLPMHRNKGPYQQESGFWSANLWNVLYSLNRTVLRQNQQPLSQGFPTLCGGYILVPCLDAVETNRGRHSLWRRHCNGSASSQTPLLLQIAPCPGTWSSLLFQALPHETHSRECQTRVFLHEGGLGCWMELLPGRASARSEVKINGPFIVSSEVLSSLRSYNIQWILQAGSVSQSRSWEVASGWLLSQVRNGRGSV